MDFGVSEGVYTPFFLQRTDARSVHFFEPSPAGRECLHSNLALNHPRKGVVHVLDERAVGAVSVEGWTSLDDALWPFEEPVLARVDIEGGEVSLLRGVLAC